MDEARVFVESVHAFTAINISENVRKQASDYLESLKTQPPMRTIQVVYEVLNTPRSYEVHIQTFALITLRQSVLSHWQTCDDNLSREIQQSSSGSCAAAADPSSFSSLIEYENWLKTIIEIRALCYRMIFMSIIHPKTAGESYHLSSAGLVAVHLQALISRKLFALPSMFPKCNDKLEIVREEHLRSLLSFTQPQQGGDDMNQFEAALIFHSIFEECSKVDRIGLLNLRIQDVLSIKKFIDQKLYTQVFQWSFQTLLTATSPPPIGRGGGIGARTALIQLLTTLLSWDSGQRFARTSLESISPYIIHPVREPSIAQMILPNETFTGGVLGGAGVMSGGGVMGGGGGGDPSGGGGLMKLAIRLEHELIYSPSSTTAGDGQGEIDSEYIKALGDLFIKIACLKFSTTLDQRVGGGGSVLQKQSSLTERKEYLVNAIYSPFLQHIVNSANHCREMFIDCHKKSQWIGCKTAIQWLSLKFENLYCLILNPECKFLSFPHSDLITTMKLLADVWLVIKNYSGRQFADEWICCLDLCLKIFSYLSFLGGYTFDANELTQQLPQIVGPTIKSMILENGWRLIEVSDEDELDERLMARPTQQHEEEVVGDDQLGTQEGLSSALKTRGFCLMEDDRYLLRIGMLAEICRICINDSLMLIAHQLQQIYQRGPGSQTDDETLDYIRFLIFLATAILTDECRNMYRSKVPLELTSIYYENVGAFKNPQGKAPWVLRRNDLNLIETEKTLTQFFQGMLHILSDEGFFTRLSDLTVVPCLVFLTRITKTFALKNIYPLQDMGSSSLSPAAATMETTTTYHSTPSNVSLMPNISSSDMANALTTGLITTCVLCFSRFASNSNLMKLTLLALGTICRADSELQPYIGQLPVFRNHIVAHLMDLDNPKSMRCILQPKDLTKVVEIITLVTLPLRVSGANVSSSSTSANGEEAITPAEWCDTLRKQAEFLTYITPCLIALQTNFKDEAVFSTSCAILRGVIRAYTRVSTSEEIALSCLHCLVTWLFCGQSLQSPEQWSQLLPLYLQNPPQATDTLLPHPKIVSTAWLDALAAIDPHMRPETYSQVCALIKLTFSVCRSCASYQDLLLIAQKVQLAINHQLKFIYKALIDLSGSGESDRAERLHWVRSMIVLLRSFVTAYQDSLVPGCCSHVFIKNAGSLSVEGLNQPPGEANQEDNELKLNLLRELINATAVPFVQQIVDYSPNSDLLNVLETEKADLILVILQMTTFLFNTRDENLFRKLSTPSFAQASVAMAGALIARASTYRKSDAEDFLSAIAYNLAPQTASGGDPSGLLQCCKVWFKPFEDLALNVILEELKEEDATSAPVTAQAIQSGRIFYVRLINDLVMATLTLLACDEQSLEQFIKNLANEISYLHARSGTLFRDVYAQEFFNQGRTMLINTRSANISSTEDSRLMRYRMLMLANLQFCDQVFMKFLADCRFARWREY